jgi:hypothetical protein
MHYARLRLFTDWFPLAPTSCTLRLIGLFATSIEEGRIADNLEDRPHRNLCYRGLGMGPLGLN